MRRTPLYAWHRAHGARMVEFAGWNMPVQYETGILREHLATRRAAGLFDVSHMGRFSIGGPDRVAFLQHVLSNNAESLSPGRAQYTLVPDDDGALIDDAYLYRWESERYLLVVNAANRQVDWDHFETLAKGFNVVLDDQSDRTAMAAIQGPRSARILRACLEGGDMPEPRRNSLSEATIAGAPVRVARTGYTGEPVGFEIFAAAETIEAVWSRLHGEGQGDGLLPVGLGARDTLRLEAGLPLYGHEYGRDVPALTVPLAATAVSFSERKGRFVGRDALARQFEQVRKLRRGLAEPSATLPRQARALALLDKGVVRQGDEVFVGDGRVGVVTSGTVTPYWVFSGSGVMATPTDETGRRAIALARVDAAVQTGREVEVVVRGRRLRARIVPCHGRSDAPPYYRPIPADVPQFSAAAGGAASRPSDPAQAAVALLERGFANDRWRQEQCVNLIPSEMTPSPLVRLLSVSDPSGRYAEHKELFGTFGREVFYYQGTDFIAWVEERLVEEMSRYLGCPHVEVRPLSGQMANAAVFGALVDARHRANPRGDLPRLRCVMNHPIGRGGHLSAQPMGALRDFVAKDPVTERFAVAGFPVCRDNPYRVDVEATGRLLDETDPDLLVFGKSMVLHREPVAEIAGLLAAAGKRPVLMYDMAHVLGLAGPHFQEPFREGIHVVTGSTHKTFFGPQRGVVGWAASGGAPMDPLGAAIRRRVFPGMVSNHHLGTQLGLLLAAMEMNAFRDAYQRQVLANAKALARALRGEGVEVEGDAAIDFTETHQVMVRVGYARGAEVARRLEENHLVVNFQALPDDESFTSSSGLRMGVAEMTRFGMGEGDFEALAGLLAEVIERGRTVRNEVVRFRSRFRAMRYCFDAEIPESLKARWLATF